LDSKSGSSDSKSGNLDSDPTDIGFWRKIYPK
jgi:hypothetical protein